MAENNGLQSDVEKLCECSICFDRVTNPRTLPCGHSFCQECLEELVLFKQKNIPYVLCPSRCGEQCLKPGSSISKMKASLYLRQLLDILQKTVPVILSRVSDPSCSIVTCIRPPKVYCSVCKEFYCNECSKHKHVVSCKDKQEMKPIQYSKLRNTVEPYCTKHECSAIYYCQSCSVNYLCRYCKQYNHLDHRVTELTFEQVYKPYKTKEEGIQNYNELFKGLNGNISCIWQNLETTESNFSRYLEKRKMELTLQFFDQLIAAENSIRQQYQSKVQTFLEDILDRKQKFDALVSKNNQYFHLLDYLKDRTLVELLFDNQISNIDSLIKENQTTYKSFSQLDDFKIFVSPNKDLDLERPFGHVNFSKDVLKDEEVIKKLQVLNPISGARKEKEEKEREKQFQTLKEKLQMLFSKSDFTVIKTRSKTDCSADESKSNTHDHTKQRSLSESCADEKHQRPRICGESFIDDREFKEKLQIIYNSPKEAESKYDHPTPPDLPERVPIINTVYASPPTVFIRKISIVEKQEHPSLSVLPEETWNQVNTQGTQGTDNNQTSVIQVDGLQHGKATSSKLPKQDSEDNDSGKIACYDSLPLRKNQLSQKQKRRPPVLPKPDRAKQNHVTKGKRRLVKFGLDKKSKNNYYLQQCVTLKFLHKRRCVFNQLHSEAMSTKGEDNARALHLIVKQLDGLISMIQRGNEIDMTLIPSPRDNRLNWKLINSSK